MSAQLLGHAASHALLGLSPWIIPVIAAAAKLTRGARPAAPAADRAPEPPNARPPRRAPTPAVSSPVVMDARFRARLEAIIWPE